MTKTNVGSSPAPDARGLALLFHAPRRLLAAYRRLVHDSRGDAGTRCGICGATPEPGRTSCLGCDVW